MSGYKKIQLEKLSDLGLVSLAVELGVWDHCSAKAKFFKLFDEQLCNAKTIGETKQALADLVSKFDKFINDKLLTDKDKVFLDKETGLCNVYTLLLPETKCERDKLISSVLLSLEGKTEEGTNNSVGQKT